MMVVVITIVTRVLDNGKQRVIDIKVDKASVRKLLIEGIHLGREFCIEETCCLVCKLRTPSQ